MTDRVLVDNDIALKIACFSLVEKMLTATTHNGVGPGMLGVSQFVIGRRLARSSSITDRARATAAFQQLLTAVALLEPNDAELTLAAEFEAEATRLDLELDVGESQLLAMLLNQPCRLLLTGDKRAIRAIAAMGVVGAKERIGCLEQLVAHLVQLDGFADVRANICTEPQADRTISICFNCMREEMEPEEALEGLESYINHLKSVAPDVLLPRIDLMQEN